MLTTDLSGTQILVGVWTEDANHYNAEKQALLNAIAAHGSDWIIAISVGSEDLYRGDTSASALAQQIYDVRGMVRAQGVQAEVGHVDTWTAWVDGANADVIRASDFIGLDGYVFERYHTTWSLMLTWLKIPLLPKRRHCRRLQRLLGLRHRHPQRSQLDFSRQVGLGHRDRLARLWTQLWPCRGLGQERPDLLAQRCLPGFQQHSHLLVLLPRLQRIAVIWGVWKQRECYLRSLRVLE